MSRPRPNADFNTLGRRIVLPLPNLHDIDCDYDSRPPSRPSRRPLQA
jgi:hypothetical protein